MILDLASYLFCNLRQIRQTLLWCTAAPFRRTFRFFPSHCTAIAFQCQISQISQHFNFKTIQDHADTADSPDFTDNAENAVNADEQTMYADNLCKTYIIDIDECSTVVL